MTADDAARRKAADSAAAKKTVTKKTTVKKKDTKKKDTKKKDTKKTETKKTETKKSGGGDTAKPMSPASYRPNVAIASAGASVFTGTNVPTAGYSQEQIDHYNARLNEAISEGDSRNANDVLFDIAYAKKGVGVSQGRSEGQGQGNERVGAVQSGMYKLDSGPLWAEQRINSTNDRYVLRDEQGAPTGERIRYDDAAGVVRGTPGNWTSVGSWGGNEKAGIIEGQPTTTPPPSGILSTGIRDLDEGGFFATGTPSGGGGLLGPPNPTVPSFGYPAYQDWTRFMPTNFQLAEGAGMHYQPWATGLPAVSAGMGDVAGPDRWIVGPPYTSGDTTTTGPGVINPNIWGTGATTTTSTTGVIPGSDKANDLAAGRTHHPEMYDHNDMWVGAEGGGRVEAMNLDKFDAPQSAAGAAFMDNLGKTVGALTNPYGFVSAFNNAYNNTQPTSTGTQPQVNWGAGVTPMSIAHLSTYPGQNTLNFNQTGLNTTNIPSYNTGIQNVSNNIGRIPTSAWNELVNTTRMEQYTDQPSGVLGDYSLTPMQWGVPLYDHTSQAGVASASKPTLDLRGLLEAEAGSQDGVSLDADFDADMGFYE